MSVKAIIRRNKTSIHQILSQDHRFILSKVHEQKLITDREYTNLKGIYKETVEGHVIEMVDTIMEKGEETCKSFINLLETDDEILETFPDLKTIQLGLRRRLTQPEQETCLMDNKDNGAPGPKKPKKEEVYPVNSSPPGVCLILNNMNFEDGSMRRGTDKDAESLAEVFDWLGFTVLLCEDQTTAQMSACLQCFSDLSDQSDLQPFSPKEWTSVGFVDLQQTNPKHGDVFICCILTHGNKGVVYGTDRKPLEIKEITRTFKATSSSPLIAKPKVFLIQACQGAGKAQRGALRAGLEKDAGLPSVPEEADILVAVATVEDYAAFRNTVSGSWFIQSLCPQLKEGCSRGEDIHSILQRVHSDVSKKEGDPDHPGQMKQMPEVRYTLTKKLLLSPNCS